MRPPRSEAIVGDTPNMIASNTMAQIMPANCHGASWDASPRRRAAAKQASAVVWMAVNSITSTSDATSRGRQRTNMLQASRATPTSPTCIVVSTAVATSRRRRSMT